MKNIFNIECVDDKAAQNMNPQVLAYIGDAVHSLYVRQMLSKDNDVKSGKLHVLSQNYVKASEQSNAINIILANLNEEELSIFKRARNYKTPSVAKNAKVGDYKKATGFEAVLGYLYLTCKYDRLNEILIKTQNFK